MRFLDTFFINTSAGDMMQGRSLLDCSLLTSFFGILRADVTCSVTTEKKIIKVENLSRISRNYL